MIVPQCDPNWLGARSTEQDGEVGIGPATTSQPTIGEFTFTEAGWDGKSLDSRACTAGGERKLAVGDRQQLRC